MKLQPLYQFLRLLIKLPQKEKTIKKMENYIIYWTLAQEETFVETCPFINIELGLLQPESEEWPDGYKMLEQELTTIQFGSVDNAADEHICIDIKPAPAPPGNPHGR